MPALVGGADAGHEARMAQRLLDGRGLVKVDREVGIAGRAGEARDEAHVQVVQAGLHHGTLLFDSDPDMVAGALNVDPEKFRSKGRKSVRSRIGNIRSFLKQDMTLQDFWAHLRVSLGKTDVAPEQLTAEELAQVQRLKEEKYDTWEWTYGRSPRYNYTGKRRWPGGNLEVYAEIHEGKAEQIRFYGDFMAAASMDAVTAALTGCQFRPEAFGKVLDGFDLPVYFGGVTKDEILQTIFDTQA